MFEYHIFCGFCNKANRISSIDLSVKYTCGFCQNDLVVSEFEEVVFPNNVQFIDDSSLNISIKNHGTDDTCGGCLLFIFGFGIFFAILLLSQDRPLTTKKETLERRLGETPIMEEPPRQEASHEKQILISELKKKIEEGQNTKQHKRLSEEERSKLWIEIFEQAKSKALNKEEFWNAFGDQIAKDYSLPDEKTGNKKFLRKSCCPFSIITGSGDDYYLVKLEEQTTKEIIFLFFKGGSNLSIKVPPGTYSFKYGYGERWYGWVFRFGPQSIFFESNQSLAFYTEERYEGVRYVGHTIELIKQRNGNFQTKPISDDDF